MESSERRIRSHGLCHLSVEGKSWIMILTSIKSVKRILTRRSRPLGELEEVIR